MQGHALRLGCSAGLLMGLVVCAVLAAEAAAAPKLRNDKNDSEAGGGKGGTCAVPTEEASAAGICET